MNLLRKTQLQNELSSLALDNPVQDTLLAEEDMERYAALIERTEN